MSMKAKFIALTVGTLLLVVAWFFLGFKPASSKLKEVKDEVTQTENEIAALETRLATLQELKRNAKQLRADARRYAEGLPTKPAVSDFIRQVQEQASDSGIEFLTVAPSAPSAPSGPNAPTAGGLKAISVSLNASGTFFQVEEFVSKMERLERAIRIDTFSLGGSAEKLSLSVKMQMFMSQAAAAAATAPGAAPPAPGASPAPAATP